ncbi:PX-associated-domain-containing protein [Echria macrotheca]|uniref:PX-associated-domain-containing protein n=1 Tax=Echria macrotheca TaxID=438768 RepID=A0AAJ0BBF9_9PEZI|nr:PX-associated-domain-containing protein [Echria macrotheca]
MEKNNNKDVDGAASALTSAQLHALLDILTHHETYAEVERFKDPTTISRYGYPFTHQDDKQTPRYSSDSSAPLLADLLNSLVLPVPGIRDLPAEFWHERFQTVLTKLSEAELSESYDKGALGTRKTLATAASAIHEAVSRGILGGVVRDPSSKNLDAPYDRSKAEDLARAWEDAVHELVYGNLVDELYDCAVRGQSLEEHSAAVQASADYIIVHLATLIHHVLVLSPEGPYLLKLIENVHKLIPYTMIRQTLRIGNAATMINGMLKLLLAKMGVGAISNWFGLTQSADDGMNLLQRIISMVLSWDSSDFRKTVDKIDRAKDGPSKDHLMAIRKHVEKDRLTHEMTRKRSTELSASIITAIFESAGKALNDSLTEDHHAQCLEYYTALLAIRDRDEITKALCRSSPDHFTQAVRDTAAAFDRMIRLAHEKVDLREHVSAAETFITDVINTSKPRKSVSNGSSEDPAGQDRAPCIEDYVSLLRRNRQSLYNWLHQLASQCPEIREDFRAWCKNAVAVFRQGKSRQRASSISPRPEEEGGDTYGVDGKRKGAAGALSSNLQVLYVSLPAAERSAVLSALDKHAAYLTSLETLSLQRMQHILDDMPGGVLAADDSGPRVDREEGRRSICGPGMFLARWQQLMNETVVAPDAPYGPLRSGWDVKGTLAQGKTVSAAVRDRWDPSALARLAERDVPQPPDVGVVVESLGGSFRKLAVDLWKHKQVGR